MQDEITKYDTTTTTTNNDSICNNDNSERMHSAFDGQVENEDREPCAFEWGEEVEESIKAELKTPTELAAAYNDLKSRVLPPEDGKYGYDGKSIALEYIDMMEGMMKDCKISKGQGAQYLVTKLTAINTEEELRDMITRQKNLSVENLKEDNQYLIKLCS